MQYRQLHRNCTSATRFRSRNSVLTRCRQMHRIWTPRSRPHGWHCYSGVAELNVYIPSQIGAAFMTLAILPIYSTIMPVLLRSPQLAILCTEHCHVWERLMCSMFSIHRTCFVGSKLSWVPRIRKKPRLDWWQNLVIEDSVFVTLFWKSILKAVSWSTAQHQRTDDRSGIILT